MLACLDLDGVPCPLGLFPGAGVEEHSGSVSSDDDAIVKRRAQVVLELLSSEALGEALRVVLLAQVDLQAPVVVHRRGGLFHPF